MKVARSTIMKHLSRAREAVCDGKLEAAFGYTILALVLIPEIDRKVAGVVLESMLEKCEEIEAKR